MTSQLDRIEWKLDMLLAQLRGDQSGVGVPRLPEKQEVGGGYGAGGGQRMAQDASVLKALEAMSMKQHATLQMVVRGASNQEIAERFGVSVNTAKVYLRSISKKLKVHLRTQVAVKALPVISAMTPEEYQEVARGLPKDWDETYAFERREDDPYWPRYTGSRVGRGDEFEGEDDDE